MSLDTSSIQLFQSHRCGVNAEWVAPSLWAAMESKLCLPGKLLKFCTQNLTREWLFWRDLSFLSEILVYFLSGHYILWCILTHFFKE